MSDKTAYQFTTFRTGKALTAYASYNQLYVEAFVTAMNAHDFVRREDLGRAPDDGRVVTRRTPYVYAKKLEGMPEGAVAAVFFTTDPEPIGYLVRAEPGSPLIDPEDIAHTEKVLGAIVSALEKQLETEVETESK